MVFIRRADVLAGILDIDGSMCIVFVGWSEAFPEDGEEFCGCNMMEPLRALRVTKESKFIFFLLNLSGPWW
ncbi:MAG: hypothetical protein WBC35_01265, partial [Saprospiraceae bacterium]